MSDTSNDSNYSSISDQEQAEYEEILFEDFMGYMSNDLKLPNNNIDPYCLFDDIDDYKERIDKPLTDELTILVKDARSTIYWHDYDPEVAQGYVNYTTVKGTRETPISLRMVLVAMDKDPHYGKSAVQRQDHNLLEFYEWINTIVLDFYYGS